MLAYIGHPRNPPPQVEQRSGLKSTPQTPVVAIHAAKTCVPIRLDHLESHGKIDHLDKARDPWNARFDSLPRALTYRLLNSAKMSMTSWNGFGVRLSERFMYMVLSLPASKLAFRAKRLSTCFPGTIAFQSSLS